MYTYFRVIIVIVSLFFFAQSSNASMQYIGQFLTGSIAGLVPIAGQLSPQTYNISGDTRGNIYVDDYASHTIRKFSSTGQLLLQFGGFGSSDTQFNYPGQISIDTNGNIYIADTFNHVIKKFDSSGSFLFKSDNLGQPEGVAVDPIDGSIYFGTVHYIYKLSSTGATISSFLGSSTFGSGNGEFHGIGQLNTDSYGNLFVVDQGNNRIQKFSSGGLYLAQFGSSLGSSGSLNIPSSILIDSQFLIVSDYGNNRIQKYDYSGQWIESIGVTGSGVGQLYYPFSSFKIGNLLYIMDSGNARIQVFQDPDLIAPTVSLNGLSTQNIYPSTFFTDSGASWTDNYDGTGIVYGSGYVNTGAIGTYILTYSKTDLAGNISNVVTRTINIIPIPVISSGGGGGGGGGSAIISSTPTTTVLTNTGTTPIKTTQSGTTSKDPIIITPQELKKSKIITLETTFKKGTNLVIYRVLPNGRQIKAGTTRVLPNGKVRFNTKIAGKYIFISK